VISTPKTAFFSGLSRPTQHSPRAPLSISPPQNRIDHGKGFIQSVVILGSAADSGHIFRPAAFLARQRLRQARGARFRIAAHHDLPDMQCLDLFASPARTRESRLSQMAQNIVLHFSRERCLISLGADAEIPQPVARRIHAGGDVLAKFDGDGPTFWASTRPATA